MDHAADDPLQRIVDAIPSWIAYVDRDRRCRLINRAYRASLSASLGDVRGRRLEEVLGPGSYERIREHVDTVLAGTPVTFEAHLPPVDVHDRWIEAAYVPDRGADGRVRGFICEVHDITARKRLEQRLEILAEASRALASPIDLASTLQVIAEISVQHVADWVVIYLEDDELTPAEIGARPDVDRKAVWRFARALAEHDPIAHAIRDRETTAIDPGCVPAGIELGAASIIVTPLVPRGRSLGCLLLGSHVAGRYAGDDVTLVEELGRRAGAALETANLLETERRINEQLTEAVLRQQEADRRKDEFLAILGHELRNPLAPILTALELIELRGATEFERERDVIKRQALHLGRLVEDLLDVSRVVREKIQLRRESVELAMVISHAVEIVSPLLEQHKHELVNAIPRTGMRIHADLVRLGQVFANLLTNAAKYTPPHGRIELTANRAGETIEVAIEDNGSGISTDLLPQLFEPFIQSERTLDRAQGGLGLGLSLVRSLTQLHGGTVRAHSDGPGTGSRFVVRLPALSAVPEGDEDESTQRMSMLVQPGGRVLVVDDNVDAADMLASVLRKVGYEVAIAHDAPAALTLAAQFRPAIALLDLGLPVMDGYELARHLRERLADAPPRLVAVSGYGQDDDVARSRAAGFDSHLGKPVRIDILVNVLGHLQGTEHEV